MTIDQQKAMSVVASLVVCNVINCVWYSPTLFFGVKANTEGWGASSHVAFFYLQLGYFVMANVIRGLFSSHFLHVRQLKDAVHHGVHLGLLSAALRATHAAYSPHSYIALLVDIGHDFVCLVSTAVITTKMQH